MSYTKITSRIAGAVLAGALSLGGLMGVGAVVADDQIDAPVEETAATWSFTAQPDGKIAPIGKGDPVYSSRATWS